MIGQSISLYLIFSKFYTLFLDKGFSATSLESIRCALFPSRRRCTSLCGNLFVRPSAIEAALISLYLRPGLKPNPFKNVGCHTDSCVPPLCRMATPRVCLDLFGEEHDDHGFLIHESRVTVISSCYISGHNVTGHSATKDYKQCSMHGTTFLPEMIFRAIFRW